MSRGAQHRVYLVPGFFGFDNLGAFFYFSHLHDFLADELAERGVRSTLYRVRTHPTASLQTRAQILLRTMRETATTRGPLHIIGHSSGGLDARLLVSQPDALELSAADRRLLDRVRTVVTVATPHHGTPLASAFTGSRGQQLIRVLSLATVFLLRYERLPWESLLRVARLLRRLGGAVSWARKPHLLDQLFEQLLDDFSSTHRAQVRRLFEEVRQDQRLIGELEPPAMERFNARTPDREAVAYASIVTRGQPPGLKARFRSGGSPYAQITHSLYQLMYRTAAGLPPHIRDRALRAHGEVLAGIFQPAPVAQDNDGVVPTFSQPWGQVLAGAEADHLDIIGHFADRTHEPPHVDWLCTGSRFRRAQFEAVWKPVVELLRAAGT